jgi:hypothetical protein
MELRRDEQGTAMSVEAPTGSRRVPWTVLLGVSAAIAVAVSATREAIRWRDPGQLQRLVAARQEALRFRPEADPPLGQLAPRLSMLDTTARRVSYPPSRANAPSALLFIGDCTGCSAKTLGEWASIADEGYAVYVVTSSDPSEARAFVADSGLRLPVLLEATDATGAGCYNAAFRPRAYVVDGSGSLLYAQPETEASAVVIRNARALLRQTAGSDESAAKQASSQ